MRSHQITFSLYKSRNGFLVSSEEYYSKISMWSQKTKENMKTFPKGLLNSTGKNKDAQSDIWHRVDNQKDQELYTFMVFGRIHGFFFFLIIGVVLGLFGVQRGFHKGIPRKKFLHHEGIPQRESTSTLTIPRPLIHSTSKGSAFWNLWAGPLRSWDCMRQPRKAFYKENSTKGNPQKYSTGIPWRISTKGFHEGNPRKEIPQGRSPLKGRQSMKAFRWSHCKYLLNSITSSPIQDPYSSTWVAYTCTFMRQCVPLCAFHSVISSSVHVEEQ
mgnify:CR=1 FL=1